MRESKPEMKQYVQNILLRIDDDHLHLQLIYPNDASYAKRYYVRVTNSNGPSSTERPQ